MGAVWRVHDLRLDRVVALKQLRQLDPELTERFRREARTLASLQDPHIVQVLDHGEVDQEVYLVMELVEGRPFDRLPPDVDPLPGWMQVGEALQTVHDQGIVHRDVKPANAVLDRHGRAVLLDFGLVHDPGKRTLTKTGHVIGSLAYIAPELLQGGPATSQADWYSWGASLFQLLEDELPFDNDGVLAVLEGRPRPPPRFQRIGADHRLRPALELLLKADPRDRPGTWPEVQDLLQDPAEASLQLVGSPTRENLGPSPLLRRSAPGTGRLPRVPLALAAALGLALAGWIHWSRAPAAPPAGPAAPRPQGEDVVPHSVQEAWRNLDAMFSGRWWDLSRREQPPLSRAEVDAFADAALDPRVPLAYQRYLDELHAWLIDLGAGDTHLGARLREPRLIEPARKFLYNALTFPIFQVRGPRGWYERAMEAHPGIGRRLVRLNEVDHDLATRLATFLLDAEERHRHLPPLLVAAAIEAKPMPVLAASGRDPRPTILVMAREVPADTPFAKEVAQAAIRHLARQQPETAVGSSGGEGLALCAANVENARKLSDLCERLGRGLGPEDRRSILNEAAYVLARCIERCPPGFQDNVTSAHVVLARMIGEVLGELSDESPSFDKRVAELRQTFVHFDLGKAAAVMQPSGPRR